METPKRTELINAIIQGYSPQQYEYETGYSLQQLTDIANIIWDTANNELDEICELKSEKEILEQRIESLEKKSEKARNLFEDILILNDEQIDILKSQIESLQYDNDELKSDIEELKLNHKQELQIAYEEGRDDYADYIDSLPHHDFE